MPCVEWISKRLTCYCTTVSSQGSAGKWKAVYYESNLPGQVNQQCDLLKEGKVHVRPHCQPSLLFSVAQIVLLLCRRPNVQKKKM